MQDFVDMAEAHEWTLRRLREMAGRLTEQAYLKASAAAGGSEPEDDEAHARWMLVFDRMARGLRLSIALEAKLHRERRWDADEIRRETQGERHAPRWRRSATAPNDRETRETDREADDDGLPGDACLAQRLDRLKAILEETPEPPSVVFCFQTEATPDALGGDPHRVASHPAEPRNRPADTERAPNGQPPWRGSG
jgi:hypothetical protein